MIRKMLQTALCITLCPLLAAGQVVAVTQPANSQCAAPKVTVTGSAQPPYQSNANEMFVELAAPDSISFEEQRVGSSFQFFVDKDVVEEGVTLLHAGAPTTGTITRVRGASERKHRGGQLDILLNDQVSGKKIRVRLIGPSPVQPILVEGPSYNPGYGPWNGPGHSVPSVGSIFNGIGIAFGIILLIVLIAAARS
jgi:hypothetical protein